MDHDEKPWIGRWLWPVAMSSAVVVAFSVIGLAIWTVF